MVRVRPDVATAMELVRSKDLEERGRGVAQLADLPDPEAGQALVQLLEETSWFVRERAVEALAARPESPASILQVLNHGAWYARASACDALGRRCERVALPGLLLAAEDRNVSLQKSAVRALALLAQEHGMGLVAEAVAGLPGERRRRIVARVAHQAPHISAALDQALDAVPRERWASDSGIRRPPPRTAGSRGVETRTLIRFRQWLRAGLPLGDA